MLLSKNFLTWPDIPECRGCLFYRPIYDRGPGRSNNVCHFLLDNGHSRGCPPGKGCTQKKEGEYVKRTNDLVFPDLEDW